MTLRQTALYEEHVELGGRIVPFAGFGLPVHYPTGIRAEHRAVREGAGLFDVSHMGQVELAGAEALECVQRLTVNDAGKLEIGQAQYSLLCREDGGVIDDLLVYRTGPTAFLLVVNAARREFDLEWIEGHAAEFDTSVSDVTERFALMALQGPAAEGVLAPLCDASLDELPSFHCLTANVVDTDAMVSRTGYTGEDGFEIRVQADRAPSVWRAILDQGRGEGAEPAGLGARDILRLEMGYPLYGADLDTDHSALEAGLGWVVKLAKGDFIGRDVLAAQRESGVTRKLMGVILEERGFPRPGYSVVLGGEEVGAITSGTVSPQLGKGIALAYLPADAGPGTPAAVRIRDREIAGLVVRPPFYRGGSR